MLARALATPLCALLLAACGAAEESSVDEFSGPEREVAQLIADLGSAAGEGDAAQICSAVLSTRFADSLKAGSRSCSLELEDALADADELTLDTQDVTVTGTRATARVVDGQGRARTVELVRQGTDWRIAALR